jgi:hypothetical protein
MGNNTVMARVFRHEPAILLYAPLHLVIWGDPGGPGYLTFDRPSDQFGSFASAAVSEVGVELDRNLAALLDHLGASVRMNYEPPDHARQRYGQDITAAAFSSPPAYRRQPAGVIARCRGRDREVASLRVWPAWLSVLRPA